MNFEFLKIFQKSPGGLFIPTKRLMLL